MTMRRCYLVRHAQTPWNLDNRIQGHSDLPLSPVGEEQAKRVAAFLASCHLRGIFTSALVRSQQTAAAIARGNGHGVEPIIERDLAEMHLGAWEGLTPAEVDARFQGAYQQWTQRPSSVSIPGAEPLSSFRQRVRQVMERIATSFDEGEYVVVSHGGVIAAILADALGADYDALLRRLRLDNAGVTALDFSARSPHVLWINATGHLDASATGVPSVRRPNWF